MKIGNSSIARTKLLIYFRSSIIRKANYYSLILPVVLYLCCFGCGSKSDAPVTNDTTTAVSQIKDSGARPTDPPEGFKHAYATANGVKIHYVIGGTGEPLILLHGFGQNWYMWNRLLPELSKHFTVIAPDLPGLGESGKPDSGYDKKTLATYIHGLVKQLGFNSIDLAGHDIGLMVAYA